MKKYIILCIAVLAIGGILLCLPYVISNHNKAENSKMHEAEIKNKELLNQSIGSNKNTVENLEIPINELESEIFNSDQVIFNNIEILYKYLTFNQVDMVKEKVQFYLLHNLNNTKECNIISESVNNGNSSISFQISVKRYKNININIKLEKDSNSIKNIEILYID